MLPYSNEHLSQCFGLFKRNSNQFLRRVFTFDETESITQPLNRSNNPNSGSMRVKYSEGVKTVNEKIQSPIWKSAKQSPNNLRIFKQEFG